MAEQLSEKVVIITGAADGIGAACVDVFLKNNYYVAALDISDQKMTELSNNYFPQYYPHRLAIYKCDISQIETIENIVKLIISRFGRIDCVINNAGVHPPVTSIDKFSANDFKKNLDINLVSNYELCRLTKEQLKKNAGTIVFVSSLVALIGQNNAAAYCASKAGQIGLIKALAIELAPEVRVNGVAPSNVLTSSMTNWLQTFEDPISACSQIENVQKLKRMAQPNEIANIIYFLASEKSSFITGQLLVADGGASLDYY